MSKENLLTANSLKFIPVFFQAYIATRFISKHRKSLVMLSLFLSCTSLYSQSSLQELASPKKVFIGNIISNEHLDDPANFRNGLADIHLREEYNAAALENYMKMSFVLPSTEPMNIHDLTVEQLRATLTEDNIEAFLSNEDWEGLRKRGHAMIWFNQAPNWLNLVGPTWTGQQVFSFTRKYILALGQICGNRVDEWDVINEAISDDAPNGQRIWRQGTWYRRANDGSMTDWGEATYENYIKMLFVWAREAQPQARLHINDYAIEAFDDSMASKNRFMRDKVKALKECGAPIDGVGFQSHLTLSDMVSPTGVLNTDFIDLIEQSIQDLASAGIEVAITELDIRICNEDRDEAFQEVAFQAYCEMALSQPNCHEVLIWGLRDEDNWITLRNDQFFAGCEDAAIVEGDDYSPKAAYDGVATAIMALPDQDEFGFAPLNQGNGAPADCGGMGSIIPDILQVSGPTAVFPGDQVNVVVNYLATDNQDVVVWFQLDIDPFTVFSEVVVDVNAGSGTINTTVDIPIDVPPGSSQYRYLAFITPDGEGFDGIINESIQNQVSVLGEDSQLIISSIGPESVSPGDSVDVVISYSAVDNQEIVVWFQLDQSPFTTYQEFRQTAAVGQNEIVAKLFIPPSVPIADDAYQYQTLLVPTGGGWPERISNISQPNIDVVMVSNVTESSSQNLQFAVFPNPTLGSCIVEVPPSNYTSELIIYTATGNVLQRQTIPKGVNQVKLNLDDVPTGLYWISIDQGASYGAVKLLKQ
jgi:endo-1,4-beta-xylanase